MELIFILTYDCNFRCTYCDVYKHKNHISQNIIEKSLEFIKNSNFTFTKVKFFGGEPLLRKDEIQYIVKNFPYSSSQFYITTNATLVNDSFMEFAKQYDIRMTFSLDGNIETTGENRIMENGENIVPLVLKNTEKYADSIRINQVITSKNAKFFFENFQYLYHLGCRKFNFLPEYYSEWSKEGLRNLKSGFDTILDFHCNNSPISLVNLENYSDLSFFNIGIIIDTDGCVYGTNLILSGRFMKYKNQLKIGDVFHGLNEEFQKENAMNSYCILIGNLLKLEYGPEVLKSVQYVDAILTNFCKQFMDDSLS